MKEIVLKYLNKNYRFTLSTLSSYILRERLTGHDIGLKDLIKSLKFIFKLEEDEIYKIFSEWTDSQKIMINNRIVEIQNSLYELGFTVELSPHQYNIIMDDDDLNYFG